MSFTPAVSQLDRSCPHTCPSTCVHHDNVSAIPLLGPKPCQASPRPGQLPTHAALHQHGATLIAMETLTLKAAWGVDTGTLAAEVRGDVALINVWGERGCRLASTSVDTWGCPGAPSFQTKLNEETVVPWLHMPDKGRNFHPAWRPPEITFASPCFTVKVFEARESSDLH